MDKCNQIVYFTGCGVLEVALKTIPHVYYSMISGVLKTLEVSVGLALPKDATIVFK